MLELRFENLIVDYLDNYIYLIISNKKDSLTQSTKRNILSNQTITLLAIRRSLKFIILLHFIKHPSLIFNPLLDLKKLVKAHTTLNDLEVNHLI